MNYTFLKCTAFGLAILLCGYADQASGSTIWVDVASTGPLHDGSEAYPKLTINEGIALAGYGDTVKVRPGVYWENVIIDKDHITLSGTGPDTTLIKANGGTALVIQADNNVTVERLAITGSDSHGISIDANTTTVSIFIRNVICSGNTGCGINQNYDCHAIVHVENCTFFANVSHGALLKAGSVFRNCISAWNHGWGFSGATRTGWSDSVPTATCCDSYNNDAGQYTKTTVDSSDLTGNPQFIDPDTGDLRLSTGPPPSPCRNTGTQGADYLNPDGTRNDMGAYGGPGATGFYNGYGSGPVVTELRVAPAAVPPNGTYNITATGKTQ